jgi:DNA-directed RNA polymerase specialized sigma54-like protein
VVRARDVIATLSPKPGAAYNTDEVKYIYPDLFVEKQDGEYAVYNNDQHVPRVRVTPGYRQILLSARKSSPADRAYVIENGKITLTGPAHELMESEEVKKAYLGI